MAQVVVASAYGGPEVLEVLDLQVGGLAPAKP